MGLALAEEFIRERKLQIPFPGLPSTTDGSGAVVWVESHISQAACAYPITPSTPMGDGFAAEFANGKKNIWGEPLEFLEPESEHSSASACEGFALAGGRVTNFTSGQGLMLMKEVLYVIAGKRLPVVFHIGARAMTSQSLNIHCGHDDVMGVADAGWGILFGRNVQETADLALIARRAAEYSETPFLNVQDGFLTTHTLESVLLPEPELMQRFIQHPELLRKLFDTEHPMQSGTVQNQDSYMKGRVAQRFFYDRVKASLRASMEEYATLTGRYYDLIHRYRMNDAEYALVGMGSMMQTAEGTVDYLRSRGMRIGAVAVTSYRPFPARQLAAALRNCKAVSVVERADVPLAPSNPLMTDLKAALADAVSAGLIDRIPELYSAVAGLGGSDVRPGHFVALAQNMMSPKRHFVFLGVRHDDALPIADDPDVRPEGAFSMRGHSVGGFGSVTTNKVIASVAADLFGLQVQAFSKYGSEKKGLPTSYYLTLAPKPVKLHAELNTVEFVAIQNPQAFSLGDPLEGLARGGTIYLQSDILPGTVWGTLPAATRRTILDRDLKLWVLDAARIAKEQSSRGDLQIRMQGIALLGAFLRLTPFQGRSGLSEEMLFQSLDRVLNKYFGKQGAKVIAENLAVARRGYLEVTEVVPMPDEMGSEKPGGSEWHWEAPACPTNGCLVAPEFCEQVIESYSHGREAELPADIYAARSLVPPLSAAHRSFRHLAPEIPELIAADCVGCMECVNQCPDNAILARVAEPEVLDREILKIERPDLRDSLHKLFAKTTKYHDVPVKRGETGGLFGIFVDPDKCKGCGECVTACGSHQALRMVPKASVNLLTYDAGMDLFHHLPRTPERFINEKALADFMLSDRAMLYSGGAGSCMGCGEGTAVRLMLAATGFVYGNEVGIVAATGCNTVFGSTYPFNPFKIPWTNSLFENAPADAMGIRLRWDQEGHQKRRLWVLGGDGALYDIGFQSLSRLLMSGLDIKVLVLDTQVYSNTGGQSSTATFTGQSAKMAAFGKSSPGKREHRKELATIAMMHPGVYVAQTTPAHLNHFYRSVMEANDYPGPAVVICYAACMPEHGIADDRAVAQAKLAVESRTFPLLIYDPRKGERIRERLSLQGNPVMKEDWFTNPKTGEPLDFTTFARTEGRFARHFTDGQPDEFLKEAQLDRLQNWRRLQELAGLR
ncbi:MAG TPA: 2-oxoacid:acceptor oxidoreductase family protein [Bryobacteraceae bacterium]|nr:2-oxoacid:acceptor oxidoreductase family protein [Bryobacteraceae bacterium]